MNTQKKYTQILGQIRKTCKTSNQSVGFLTSEPSGVRIGTRIDVDALALLQTNLSAKLTTLEALDKELVELVPAEELEDQLGRADEYLEKIHKMLEQIRKTFQNF